MDITLASFLSYFFTVVLAGKQLPSFNTHQRKVLHDDVAVDEEAWVGSYGLPPTRRHNRDPQSFRHSPVAREARANAYAAPSLDSLPTHQGTSNSLRDPAGGTKDPALQNEKQVVTGIPDLSDPCFRRYSNSIIVNAQPYERRSSISLVQCKTQCLLSQVGVYSCRSFVYDNVNQVCDLFAHVGDQSPARLLRFQTRDYFEPTAAVSCKAPEQHEDISLIPQTTVKTFSFLGEERTTTSFTPTTTQSFEPIAAVSELTPDDNTVDTLPTVTTNTLGEGHSHNLFNSVPLNDGKGKNCENGEVSRFLKTADFELHQHDDMRIESVTLDECIEYCSSPTALKEIHPDDPRCNSFEYNDNGVCILSRETAVPLGNGQLKQKSGTAYYEKVCIDTKLTQECPSTIYNRYPQKILVGFAETVVDAPSLQHCFDNCLNSRQLYGFKCASGMYYFEEPQLNCILNTEDRTTQPDLFTSENSDLVDYFETSCNQSNTHRRFAPPRPRSLQNKDFVDKSEMSRESLVMRQAVWTEWSECSGGLDSIQTRKKICNRSRLCGSDKRKCNKGGDDIDIMEMVEEIRRNKCPLDVCCPILGKCIGIIQISATKRMDWCKINCKN